MIRCQVLPVALWCGHEVEVQSICAFLYMSAVIQIHEQHHTHSYSTKQAQHIEQAHGHEREVHSTGNLSLEKRRPMEEQKNRTANARRTFNPQAVYRVAPYDTLAILEMSPAQSKEHQLAVSTKYLTISR
jgi:hypothetical protein